MPIINSTITYDTPSDLNTNIKDTDYRILTSITPVNVNQSQQKQKQLSSLSADLSVLPPPPNPPIIPLEPPPLHKMDEFLTEKQQQLYTNVATAVNAINNMIAKDSKNKSTLGTKVATYERPKLKGLYNIFIFIYILVLYVKKK